MPTITFKVSASEAARIRRLAKRAGYTVSEFIRRRAMQVQPTGAEQAAAEQVRNLMTDFP